MDSSFICMFIYTYVLSFQFRTYDALRREHDSQIVQIALEAGLRISPEQWSALLYGDQGHKSHMQSIIDKVKLLKFIRRTAVFFRINDFTRIDAPLSL